MTSETVRWGVLSTAGINDRLIPGLLAAEGCELAGIASRSADRAGPAAARWDCRPYPSYEALLGDPSIDAVYVPLPNHLHAEWTVRALEAGKHVLCEKPLALSVGEVDAIDAAARRTGRHVLEAFMYRHAPRWRRAVALVASGAIGAPRVVRIGFAFRVPTDLANIRFIPEAGGGIVWDMGCYAVNMARGLLGTEPTELFAFADVREGQPTETTVTGVMRFPDHVTAPFWVSFDFGNPFAQVEVVGSDGWMLLPGTGIRGEPFTRLLLHRGDTEVYEDGAEPAVETFPFVDPFRLEVEHLASAIRGRAPLEFTLADARANTATLVAMHAAIESRAPWRVAHVAG
ncbi:MAG: Gfo/Idh/MocA family protein [Candidatus Dormibacteria bacterium]